ncbi:UNVERIFIED_CONTAM: hypothetical protein K2H54_010270 [Gekko kuhli]
MFRGMQRHFCVSVRHVHDTESDFIPEDIRHPEELSLLRKPRDPTKKKKKKLDDQYEDETLELEGPLITPGSVADETQKNDMGVCSEIKVDLANREGHSGLTSKAAAVILPMASKESRNGFLSEGETAAPESGAGMPNSRLARSSSLR